jgi:hypothetical protein
MQPISGVKVEVYIRPEGYKKLFQMMEACCGRAQAPKHPGDPSDLYWSDLQLEIETPACLVLLSSPEWDDAHRSMLNTVDVVKLTKIAYRPGWWSGEVVK